MAHAKKAVKGMTKTELFSSIAEKCEISKVQVSRVFDALRDIVVAELKHGRPISVPDLLKIVMQHKKATPAREGRNPATGESIRIKAKPARSVVKARILKKLKDAVQK